MRPSCLASSRGFTLSETAMVFGVVGIMLGGVWLAAGVLNKDANIRRATEDTLVIVENIRGLFSGASKYDDAVAVDADITNTMLDANVFPAPMRTKTPSGNPTGPARDPWGNNYEVRLGTGSRSFRLILQALSHEACRKYTFSLLNTNGLTRVQSSTGWITPNTLQNSGFSCAASPGNPGKFSAGHEFSFWPAPQ